MTVRTSAPFRCAAFSITSCKASGSVPRERWLVNPNGLDWESMFAVPKRPGEYEEEAFRQVATESGWRLVKTVPVNQRQRRLYYEKAR